MCWNATSQDVIDHIVFAGADDYDWYVDLHVDGDTIVCAMENPDDPNSVIQAEMPANALRLLVNKYVSEERAGYKHIVRAINDDDFDANDADIVLQWWVLGDIVYG
jgi:hypothetical protein